MKIQTQKHEISVSLTANIQLDMRDLSFLSHMCKHCIKTNMSGSFACEALETLLSGMKVPDLDDKPIYGIFGA